MVVQRAVVENGDIIWGWKSIAYYLHVSTRTAQYWAEKSGLPVRQMESPHKDKNGPKRKNAKRKTKGRKGSVVWAFREEVERWLRRQPLKYEVGRQMLQRY